MLYPRFDILSRGSLVVFKVYRNVLLHSDSRVHENLSGYLAWASGLGKLVHGCWGWGRHRGSSLANIDTKIRVQFVSLV